jgi:sugar lactone lactonase YvrE
VSEKPRIERISPPAAIAGGEVTIYGRGFRAANRHGPQVRFGERVADLVVAADDFVVASVPEGAAANTVSVVTADGASGAVPVEIGTLVADNLHPVANPAIDSEGDVYVTFSGRRGQKVPVSLFRIDPQSRSKPFLSGILNATGLAFDSGGTLYVSSRYDGVVYQVDRDARKSVYAEGMGVATGLAFDADENLYVGDRTGTIFKVGRDRQIFVFATLEPSVAAYHLAFGSDGLLFVTGPTTSSNDAVYRINDAGQVSVFYRGLGRPQGLAFDPGGNLYVTASWRGRRGIVRFLASSRSQSAPTPDFVIAGPNLVGLAFAPTGGLFLATINALYRLNWPDPGRGR